MQERTKIKRHTFAKIKSVAEMPYLLDLQLSSFNTFLQLDTPSKDREKCGLQAVFESIFPISDVHNSMNLEFEEYSIGVPKYSIPECIQRDMTHAAPLKATLRLDYFEKKDGKTVVKEAVRQQVFLGELPQMTKAGTFVINGAERVIVSQLHRSPGVFFGEETHPNGKLLFNARIIPYRGSWVEFSLDINDIMYAHIDRKRKFPATMLLRAFGYEDDMTIRKLFFNTKKVAISTLKAGMIVMEQVADKTTGEVVVDGGDELTDEHIETLLLMKIRKLELVLNH